MADVYVLEAPDLDSAVATAAMKPAVREGGGVEVRPTEGNSLETE